MDIVLDSSSIFNLINGGCIDKLTSMKEHKFFIGDLIMDQEILNPLQQVIVDGLIQKGILVLVSSEVTTSQIINLQNKYGLGLGETECMAICINKGFVICTDDLKARKSSKKEFGEENVIGSMSLLREGVRKLLLQCDEAIDMYHTMIIKGGFLPKKLNEDYFCQ
ncbi:hypothetical protein OQZ33_04220 [Pedobacter sp. MC2016-05]|uniref:hypothetical protein n=1 Tax=Pedobacter sp. MC2016-05 TaxID=2994474 RepID=UPI0022468934|nr:hypothetical protein [Pedobacter sp. MC2016-05]MCX2473531.1 hypothetical protein [Pedobacter sp. MC2016-05]